MTSLLPPATIQNAFLTACRAELQALKPGNVHIYADGHDMTVAHFEAAAVAAAPIIADPALRVGARIRLAVEASFAAAGCNTNLGILLLCAPVAMAAGMTLEARVSEEFQTRQVGDTDRAEIARTWHARLTSVLRNLDTVDTRDVFAAIARANPGGLGTAADMDVRATPPEDMHLLTAMQAASDRDAIAREYATGFVLTSTWAIRGIPDLFDGHTDPAPWVTDLYMTILATVADTHIARKYGDAVARAVQQRAVALRHYAHKDLTPKTYDPERFSVLMDFDTELKTQGYNPGAVADLTVCTLFISALMTEIGRQTLR